MKEKKWVYTIKDDVITFSLNGINGIYHCVLRLREDSYFLSFVTYLGINCPAEKRPEMAQLLSQVNSNLMYGSFEMNIYNGEIKCRTGSFYEGIKLNSKFIDNIVIKNIYAMDICSVEFSKFIYGNISILEVYDTLYPPSLPLIELPEEDKKSTVEVKPEYTDN